jgi:hypothetical protein
MNPRPFSNNLNVSSLLNTDTLQESQLSVAQNSRNTGKQKNFLEALNYVNSNKNRHTNSDPLKIMGNNNTIQTQSIQLNMTTEGLNVSEYSRTNAHFSREEHVISLLK